MLAIEVLVQAVEVAGHILQQQRSGALLSRAVAACQERGVIGREAHGLAERPVEYAVDASDSCRC